MRAGARARSRLRRTSCSACERVPARTHHVTRLASPAFGAQTDQQSRTDPAGVRVHVSRVIRRGAVTPPL